MASRTAHVRYPQRSDGKFEWQLRAKNGRRVCGSEPQGFNTRSDARRAFQAARDIMTIGVRIPEQTADQ